MVEVPPSRHLETEEKYERKCGGLEPGFKGATLGIKGAGKRAGEDALFFAESNVSGLSNGRNDKCANGNKEEPKNYRNTFWSPTSSAF